jgi:hypothetical protein
VKCRACGAAFHLGYHFALLILLWFFFLPIYLIMALYLSMFLFHERLVVPGFLGIVFLSAFSLIYLGNPRLKKSAGAEPRKTQPR